MLNNKECGILSHKNLIYSRCERHFDLQICNFIRTFAAWNNYMFFSSSKHQILKIDL